jgi:phospholipase C
MRKSFLFLLATAAGAMTTGLAKAQQVAPPLAALQTIVVIYAENRSFDNLYGNFPRAKGLQNVTPSSSMQRDRNGQPFKELPPVWDGLTAKGVTPVITQVQTEHLPNAPFRIDDPNGFNTKLTVATRDLWHRFYQHQMQIYGGRNDHFVAYADTGVLVWDTTMVRACHSTHSPIISSWGVRWLLPQPLLADLRLHAGLPQR